MPGPITTQTFPDFSKPILERYYNEGSQSVEDVRSQIYDVRSTDEWFIQERSYYGPSVMQATPEYGLLPFGEMTPFGNRTLTCNKWALGLRWSDEQVEFDKYDLVKPAKTLGMVRMQTEQVLSAQYLLSSFSGTTSSTIGGLDGHMLFSTAHPIPGGATTYSNKVSTNTAYSYLGVQEAFDIMALTPDANNFVMDFTIGKLIVPVAKQLVSREIFGSDLNPNTSTNATNVFNRILTLGDVIHWNMLDKYRAAGTYPWFARAAKHDLRWYNHRAPKIQTWRSYDTESSRATQSILVSYGHFDFRGWVVSAG